MEKTVKNQVWNFNDRIDAEVCAEGVERKILAYTDELMCVENHFKKGAVGALHHHPHTQITYVVSGSFEFEIDGVRRVIKPGDALLKRNDIEHGCVCLEDGILLDIFTPMRQELSLIHISEPTRRTPISDAVFCLKKFFFNDTATTEIYTV